MTAGAVLCGFYGRDNLGDEAILAGLLDALDEARPSERHLVLSASPTGTRVEHDVEAIHFQVEASGRRAIGQQVRLLRALRSRDAFILGGGDLLRDSPTQDVAGRWLRTLSTAQRAGRRTAVVGISVGDLWKPETKEMIRNVLSRTSFVIARDHPSVERLQAMGVTAPVCATADLALRVFRREHRRPRPHGAPPRVVVAVRGLADRADSSTESVFEKARLELARALDTLSAEGATIELVPFRSRPTQLRPVDDDYVAALELAHTAAAGSRFTVHRHVPDVTSVRRLLADADLVIGMRLHAVIMAVGMGVPVLALSYDRKVEQFCAEVGLNDLCFSLDRVRSGDLTAAAQDQLSSPAPTSSEEVNEALGGPLVVDRLREWQ